MPRFLRDLKRHARSQLRLVGKLEKATSLDSSDGVHDLRVGLRRLRLLLRLAEAAGDADARPLRREARKIGRALSAVRDFDVLIERVEADALEGSAEWLLRLAAEREEAVGKAKQVLARDRTERWCKHALEWSKSRSGGPERDEILPGLLKQHWADFAREYSPATSHELRIHTKHLRYLVEFFPETVANPEQVIEQLTAVQDRLGEGRDMALAAERARAEGLSVYGDRLGLLSDQAIREGLKLSRKTVATRGAAGFPSAESTASDTPSR